MRLLSIIIALSFISANAFSQGKEGRSLSLVDNKITVSAAINIVPLQMPYTTPFAKDINFKYRFFDKVPLGFTFSVGPGIMIHPSKKKIDDYTSYSIVHIDFNPGLFIDYPIDAGRYITFNPRVTAYYNSFYDYFHIIDNRYGIDKSKVTLFSHFLPVFDFTTEWRWGQLLKPKILKPFTLELYASIPIGSIARIDEKGNWGLNLRYFIFASKNNKMGTALQ